MRIVASSLCKQGGRDYNQDFVACSLQDDAACLVVCDGLGSYFGSEVASTLGATRIIECFEDALDSGNDDPCSEGSLMRYVSEAHNFVSEYKERNPKISSSCTTVACVVSDCFTTSMGHIGDTRIYFFRKGKLAYQSRDHSMAQLAVDMGQISLADIRSHKDQNKLTRVLGSDYFASPHIEVLDEPLEIGDSFVICTDGFWEYIFENEMEEFFLSGMSAVDILKGLEQLLLKRVGKYNDNYSAVVAIVVE